MVQNIIRMLFLLVVIALTASFAFQKSPDEAGEVTSRDPLYITLYITVPALAAFGLVLVDMFWRRKRLHMLSGLFFGMLGGLVIAYGLGLIVDLVLQVFPALTQMAGVRLAVPLIKVLLGATAVFICASFVLQTKDDFRFVIPYVEFAKEAKGARPLLLDTSVIIDGRIVDIVETRIIDSELIVPRFVLSELQSVADSTDKLRRNRGRRGLDVLDKLQRSENVDLIISDINVPGLDKLDEVDAKLVALSEHLSGRIVTNDYNLNKIAQLRGVDVININDLANAMKPVALPGESLQVKVIKPGEDPGQGVGYLDDGTMVVAEQGRDYIGRDITIMVTSVLQTSAGRMIFGKLDPDKTFGPQNRTRPGAPDGADA